MKGRDCFAFRRLGADFVMLGGMLAGHDESGSGEVIERNGRKYKLFYGMSSKTAMDKHVMI